MHEFFDTIIAGGCSVSTDINSVSSVKTLLDILVLDGSVI